MGWPDRGGDLGTAVVNAERGMRSAEWEKRPAGFLAGFFGARTGRQLNKRARFMSGIRPLTCPMCEPNREGGRDDAGCVGRRLQGVRDAFGDLVRRYEYAVYGLALSYLRDFTDAEDLAQEAFAPAYQNLSRLQSPAKFGPWLKTTVVNMRKNAMCRRESGLHPEGRRVFTLCPGF